MTPLPKRRLSTARSGKRQRGYRLKGVILVKCPNCQQPKIPHLVCSNCGYYDQKMVIPPKLKKKKGNENG